MSKIKQTLQRLLNNLLTPRITALERNENAMKEEIKYCERIFDEITNSTKINLSDSKMKNHSDIDLLKTPYNNQVKPKNLQEQTKNVNRPFRSKTPVQSGRNVRNTSNNRLNKDGSAILNTKKKLENSNILTQKNSSRNNTNITSNGITTKSFVSSKS